MSKKKIGISILAFTLVLAIGLGFLISGIIQIGPYTKSRKAVNSYIEEVFHDQGYIYMQPLEPKITDNVTIRIRVKRGNITSAAILYSVDVDETMTAKMDYRRVEMRFEAEDETGYYEYWVGIIPAQGRAYKYRFEVNNNYEKVYVNALNLVPEENFISSNGDFYVMPGFKTPDWAKGATWYSIMPDGFFNGDIFNDKLTSSDVVQNPWGNSHYGQNDYFGGDLKGIEKKIAHLKELNITAVSINPIWLTNHQAGYGSFDLTQVDAGLGTNEGLKELINILHQNGIKVVLDGVFQYIHQNSIYVNKNGSFPLAGDNDILMRDQNGQIVYSTWGQPFLDFSKKITRDFVYASENSIMQIFLREYDADGWRLDVGNDLRGSDSANWGDSEQIVKDMRKYVKAIGEDKLLLSEHGDGKMLTDYTLDSKWNFDFFYPMGEWMGEEKPLNLLEKQLFEAVVRMPRSLANASYNFIANHDFARALFKADGNVNNVMAAQILMMTYVGSPCIFYGDETGMEGIPNPGVPGANEPGAAPTSFSSMNWDKNTWNKDIYGLQKSLGNLRKDYAKVFHDGVYKSLLMDLKNNIFSFARWNDGGKVVSIVSQNDEMVENIAIDVRQIGMRDGELLTDYLTGETYYVKDGQIIVHALPGGTVLVSGAGDTNGVGFYNKDIYGNNNSSVVRISDKQWELSGKAVTSKSSDSITFINREYKNNVSIAVGGYSGSGSFALMIRSAKGDNSSFYAAIISNNGIKVQVRQKEGGAVKTIYNGNSAQEVRVRRSDANSFVTEIKNNNDWQPLVGSEAMVNFGSWSYCGFSPYEGKILVNDIVIESQTSEIWNDFSQNSGGLFDFAPDQFEVADGKLILHASEKFMPVGSEAPLSDWSVQTRVLNRPLEEGDIFGISVYQDNNVAVILGIENNIDTSDIVFGMYVNGSLIMERRVTLQEDICLLRLEKIGAEYRAAYSTGDGDFNYFSHSLNANFSQPLVGLFNLGKTDAVFEYFGYGNGDEGDSGIGAHGATGDISYSMQEDLNAAELYNLKVQNGNWEYEVGGICQNAKSNDVSMLAITGRDFDTFKATFSLRLDSQENGWVGFSFGNSTENFLDEKAFMLRMTGNGMLSLYSGQSVLGTYQIVDFDSSTAYRFVVMAGDGNISVLFGESLIPIINIKNTGYKGGYLLFAGQNAEYSIRNWNFYHVGSDWLIGRGTIKETDNGIYIDASTTDYAYGSLKNVGVSDFAIGYNLQFYRTNPIARGKFGFLFGAGSGKTPQDGGLYIFIDDLGNVNISENGVILASKQLDLNIFDLKSCYMLITRIGKNINIYMDAYKEGDQAVSQESFLSFTDSKTRGGCISIYTEFCRTTLANLNIYGLANGEKVENLEFYKNRPIEEPPLDNPEVSTEYVKEDLNFDFHDKYDLAKLNCYSGIWNVKDGVLVGDGSGGNWNAGATIAAGRFRDFEISFKMRCDGEPGTWGGIIFNKAEYNQSHETAGCLLFSYVGMAELDILAGGSHSILKGGLGTDEEGYLQIVVRVVNGVVQTWVNNERVKDFNISESGRPNATEGYISFNAGNSVTYFKDVSIKIL